MFERASTSMKQLAGETDLPARVIDTLRQIDDLGSASPSPVRRGLWQCRIDHRLPHRRFRRADPRRADRTGER
jgi:hypothetical protein